MAMIFLSAPPSGIMFGRYIREPGTTSGRLPACLGFLAPGSFDTCARCKRNEASGLVSSPERMQNKSNQRGLKIGNQFDRRPITIASALIY